MVAVNDGLCRTITNFDSARAELENLIDDALAEGGESSQQQLGEIVAWLDHALAGSDEAAVCR